MFTIKQVGTYTALPDVARLIYSESICTTESLLIRRPSDGDIGEQKWSHVSKLNEIWQIVFDFKKLYVDKILYNLCIYLIMYIKLQKTEITKPIRYLLQHLLESSLGNITYIK